MTNKYDNWIYRPLDIGLAVNRNGNIEMSVKDDENGREYTLLFSNADTEEEIIQRIGTEIYSWISLMKMQIDLVKLFEEAEETEEVILWWFYDDIDGAEEDDNEIMWASIDKLIEGELGFVPYYEVN